MLIGNRLFEERFPSQQSFKKVFHLSRFLTFADRLYTIPTYLVYSPEEVRSQRNFLAFKLSKLNSIKTQ